MKIEKGIVMKREKIVSLANFFFICCFLLPAGCAAPVMKMSDPLPPIVKKYKNITINSSHPGLVNTGIYLDKGTYFPRLAY